MGAILTKLEVYFSYSFVQNALIVGVLIAFCSSLLGVTLVLKRYSFIGDGLSHVAFGAMAIASVLSLIGNTWFVLGITVAAAVFLLRTGQNAKINGDAMIAMVSVGSLAAGYLIMNVFSTSSNISGDVCSALFGSTSILTLSSFDVWICIVMSIIVTFLFWLFYHKIFAITFDENFAKATGIQADFYNLFLAVTTAIVIVLAMNLVGSLLISAFIIFPALSAMRIFKSFQRVTLCSAGISILGAMIGILLSILWSTPVGATIVMVDIGIFFIFLVIGRILEGIRS